MATESNATGPGGGVWLWLRIALYVFLLPPALAGVPALGGIHGAVPAIAGLALVAAAAAWPRSRRAVARAVAGSRALRAADALLWNLVLLLAIGQVALGIASRFVASPLLATPNARSRERIAEQRALVLDHFGPGAGNARGHNDREPLADARGVVRIVALGDSFAYGVVGYEANFLTRLETELAQRAGAPVEVVNLGLPNLQPKEYLQMLLDEGLPLHPDLVLVCLFTGNDLKSPGGTSFYDARNWRAVAFATRLFGFVRETLRARSEPAPTGAAAPQGWIPRSEPFSEEAYLDIARRYVPFVRRPLDPDVREGIEAELAIVAEIAARAAPVPVAVAVLPSELQVNPALRARVLADLGLGDGDLDLEAPVTASRAALEPRGVTVIDLLPALAAAERDAPTYAPRDSHWNPRGNAVAAQVLADALAAPVRAIAATKRAGAGYGRQSPPAEEPP